MTSAELTIKLIDKWDARRKANSLVCGTHAYQTAHNHFWYGAALAAEALGTPLSPAVGAYIVTGRDMLNFESQT